MCFEILNSIFEISVLDQCSYKFIFPNYMMKVFYIDIITFFYKSHQVFHKSCFIDIIKVALFCNFSTKNVALMNIHSSNVCF